jgi:hypothetical protein
MDIDGALDELLLTRPVTRDEIVRAYRRMAVRFHPDKAVNPEEKLWVQKKFIRIQEAYDLLKESPTEQINAPRNCAGVRPVNTAAVRESVRGEQRRNLRHCRVAVGICAVAFAGLVAAIYLASEFAGAASPRRASASSQRDSGSSTPGSGGAREQKASSSVGALYALLSGAKAPGVPCDTLIIPNDGVVNGFRVKRVGPHTVRVEKDGVAWEYELDP